MQEQILKDWRGRIIGYIQTQQNGDAKIYDFYRRLLGTYNKALDIIKVDLLKQLDLFAKLYSFR